METDESSVMADTPAGTTPRVNKSASAELPNLMLSTTYALNKSNSKRILVGLEYHGGSYRPVIKLCSTGSPAKYVTLDKYSWELITDQMETMNAYLEDAFTFSNNFGKPAKIYLPSHDINFTLAYGMRAIVIDERPNVPAPKLNRGNEPEAQHFDGAGQFPDSASSQLETPCKKRKYGSHPGIVMQHTTLKGLWGVRECIDMWLKQLEENVGFINRSIDSILEFLKLELNREGTEKAKNILKDSAAFKQFYTLHKMDINNRAKIPMEFANINKELYDIFLTELCTFGLPNLATDLYDYMFKM